MRNLITVALLLLAFAIGVIVGRSMEGTDRGARIGSRRSEFPDSDESHASPGRAPNVPTTSPVVIPATGVGDPPRSSLPSDVRIAATVGRGLRVRVVDGRECGLPGVAVTAIVGTRASAGVTSTDGTLDLPDTPEGRATVQAAFGGRTRTVRDVEIASGTLAELTIVLGAGRRMSGTVRHVTDGPLGGVRVRLGPYDSDSEGVHASATTDGQGSFLIEGVGAGRVRAILSGGPLGRSLEFVLEIPDGDTVFEHEFVVGRVRLEGLARDRASRVPLAGVAIRVFPADRSVALPVAEVTTDQQGVFRVEDLPTGNFRIEALQEGYARATAPGVRVGDAASRIEIELDRAATLRLFLRDARGDPLTGELSVTILDLGNPSGAAVSYRTRASQDGEVVLKELAPGRYRLLLRQGATRATVDVDLRSPESVVRADLEKAE